MEHLPPSRIVAATLDPAEQAHLETCRRCRNERNVAMLPVRVRPPEPPAVSRAVEYCPEHVIGRGSASVVYAARHVDRREWFAIKVVSIDAEEVGPLQARVTRFSGVRDAHIVSFDEVTSVDGDLGLVAPLVDGSSLAALFVVFTFTEEQGAALLSRILHAVRVLHRLGLAHGSLRATNVLLDPGEDDVQVRLMDPGLVGAAFRDDLQALANLAIAVGERSVCPPAWVAPFVSACEGASNATEVPPPISEAGPETLADVTARCRDLRDRWAVLTDREPTRYRRHFPIGFGANGIVYRAWDSAYGCEVAIKMLLPNVVQTTDLTAEFRRLQLIHPNLVTMYDSVASPPSIVMELVDGTVLDPALHGDQIESIAVQLFDGLSALHAEALFHRDIKLRNLLLEPGGRLVIVDFGLSRNVGAFTGVPEGTRGYFAPEVLALREPTPAVDIYAAGIVLFELARGATWGLDEVPTPEEVARVSRDAQLAGLINSCLQLDPTARPTAQQARARLATPAQAPYLLPRLDGPFVGRAEEVYTLRRALVPGAVLRIVGPPGIGKTRLVRETLPARRLVGRCSPNEAVAFNAIERPMADLGVQPLDADATDVATATTVRQFVDRWREDNVPLVIDDAQWMDADSQRFLRALLRAGDHPPMVLIHRPVDEHHPLAELMRPYPPTVHLQPLPASAVTDLGQELQIDASEAAIARCKGNPLLLTRLALRGPDYETDLLGRVPLFGSDREAAREVLRLVALHGGPIPTPVLSMVAHSGRFAQILTTLVRSRILAYVTTRSVDFVHDSERDFVLSELAAEERRPRHAAMAEAFEWPPHRDPAALALHWFDAGRSDRARAPALEAADIGERAGAWARAARFYEVALDGDPSPDPVLTRRMADALANAGYNRRAGEQLRDARATADRIRAAELLCASADLEQADRVFDNLLSDLGLPRNRSPHLDFAIGIMTWIRLRPPALAEQRDREAEQVSDLLWSLTGSFGQFDPLRTFRYVPLHVRHAFRSGDPTRAARALASHLVYFDGNGASLQRLRELDDQVDELLERASPDVRGFVSATRGYRKVMRGELLDAIRFYEDADRDYRGAGISRWEWTAARTHHVFAEVLVGEHHKARARYDALLERYRDVGDRAIEALLEVGAGVILALVDDDPDEAAARLGRSRALLPNRPFAFQSLELAAEVILHLYRSEPDRAREVLARSRVAMSFTRLLFRTPRVQLLFLEGLTPAPHRAWLRRRIRRLRRVPISFAALRAETLSVLDARRYGGDLVAAATRCHALASALGAADHADAAALAFEPASVVFERARARGVRAPERWLAIFGGPEVSPHSVAAPADRAPVSPARLAEL